MLIGVVSDTHSYLNARVAELLRGVDHILHAGDIGDSAIIEELGRIAPVTAVRGNIDRDGPASLYPADATLDIGGSRIFLTHQIKLPKPADTTALEVYVTAGVDAVVFGHSHIALQEWRGEILFFNPGAAGKRRFNTVPSVGLLAVERGWVEGSIILL